MRALLPEPLQDVDVVAHYAQDWVDRGGLRANMVASADGAAAAAGRSRGLQTPGDNRVFAALRDLADVVLVGSATVQSEDYGPVRLDEAHRERRHALGLGERLPIAVVSRSLRLDTTGRLFADNRPLVVTCASSDPLGRAALAGHAEVLVCGDDDIDFGAVRAQLAERGFTRVLCEGGPTIVARVIITGQLDELCLTVSPLLAGPGAGRIVAGDGWSAAPPRMALRGLLEEDDALFLRFVRAGS